MSWVDRYKDQAQAWRLEAHRWSTHGKEVHAAQALDIAHLYDQLAEEEPEEGAGIVTLEEARAADGEV